MEHLSAPPWAPPGSVRAPPLLGLRNLPASGGGSVRAGRTSASRTCGRQRLVSRRRSWETGQPHLINAFFTSLSLSLSLLTPLPVPL